VAPFDGAEPQIRYLRQFDNWLCFDADGLGWGGSHASILLHGKTGAMTWFYGKVDAMIHALLISGPCSLEEDDGLMVAPVRCFLLPKP
jgi:hypothetical protein